MAQTYRLTLSDEDKTVKTKILDKDKKSVIDSTEPMKNVEKAILTSLITLSASDMGNLGKFNSALDFAKQIDDADNEIILDKIDIELINDGFKLSVGKRPEIWNQCTKFLKQLEKPEEIKI